MLDLPELDVPFRKTIWPRPEAGSLTGLSCQACRPAESSARRLRLEVGGQIVEHLRRAFLAQRRRLGPVYAVQEGALLGVDQRRAVTALDELDGGDGYRDPRAVGVHLVAVDDPLVRHDVVVQGVVAVGGALPLVAEALPPAGPEVKLGAAGVT